MLNCFLFSSEKEFGELNLIFSGASVKKISPRNPAPAISPDHQKPEKNLCK